MNILGGVGGFRYLLSLSTAPSTTLARLPDDQGIPTLSEGDSALTIVRTEARHAPRLGAGGFGLLWLSAVLKRTSGKDVTLVVSSESSGLYRREKAWNLRIR